MQLLPKCAEMKKMISYDNEKKQFHLQTKNFSHVFKINQFGYLRTLHTGRAVSNDDMAYLENDIERGFCPTIAAEGNTDRKYSLDSMPNEYPIFGFGDFRQSAILASDRDGSRSHDLKYAWHEISETKPSIQGLPSLSGGQTLIVALQSPALLVKIFYTVYEDFDCLARRVEVTNTSDDKISLNRIMSLSVDLHGYNRSMGILHGKHVGECTFEVMPLRHGINAINNTRGSGSHQFNPFMCVCDKTCDEYNGEVFGFNLIYGGNFICSAEVDQTDCTRIQVGINPYDFCYPLEAGKTFNTPECVMNYSCSGFNQMSQNFHDIYRTHLINKNFVYSPRPIVINNWEATYFNFDNEKLCHIIDSAKGLGINTFVLDDGWFGERNNDVSGLGDWTVNTNKLKGGLYNIIGHCKQNGFKFGLWFEPEMVSVKSKLYESHPDWCICVPGISPTFARSQLVLDLTRKEVRKYIVDSISQILDTYEIDYIKWDFNRNITDSYSSRLCHDFMLGFYEVVSTLTSRYPSVLFEGCSGGGGRFDPGMLAYFPQIWTSDCTDAFERTKIQYGTSICYPVSTMSSHVSASPNHQTLRVTPLQSRIDIASHTAFGYELNPDTFNDEERVQIANANARHELNQDLILHGDLFRLSSPFEGNFFSWLLISKDKTRAALVHFSALARPNPPIERLKLKGLDENKNYRIKQLELTLSGKTLMNAGIPILPQYGDFISLCYDISSVE